MLMSFNRELPFTGSLPKRPQQPAGSSVQVSRVGARAQALGPFPTAFPGAETIAVAAACHPGPGGKPLWVPGKGRGECGRPGLASRPMSAVPGPRV